MKTLLELSALIGSSLDIQSVLRNAMNCAQAALDAEASAIFELDRSSGELFFRVVLGDAAERAKEVRIKIGEGIAGEVARTGRPLIVSDAVADPRFCPSVDAATGFETRSILCVPMIYKGELTGVLEVLNKKGGGTFAQSDLEMLSVIAGQVAIAMENATLYTKLNREFALTTEELNITQEKLIRSERMAALGKLSQGVAHEVRNPVTIIGGFARRLQAQFAGDESVRTTIEIILKQAERLERMVTDIENFTKLRQPVPRPTDLSASIEAVLAKFAGRLDVQAIRVIRLIPPDLAAVEADQELLELALGNVILNAIEAMPGGGVLELTVSPEPGRLLVSIKDTGVGILPEDLPNVFDPFFTSKTSGSGLGLATAHRIISDFSGEIEIDSVPGEGTKVEIRLPCRERQSMNAGFKN